ncbi:Gfo/Idh/MocA family protein [Actinotalea sp. Marseille-Q4924]|uniref:Gfo/Idh/MocA family protein n=1 Tax=Actinotalea sp. Marseille-Q4924 TaxID=2866571 RepID=UPI001CE44B9F|nr:Gfo/Idh/MocA family oxidoreductase [Actinotalea sp. Marseille-Q4924]
MTSRRLRAAIVGCGTIAPTHARALLALADDVELVACSDVVPERAAALADAFGIEARPYADVLADPTIDLVSVCTPSGLHAEVGVPALLAGKHVVVEKPMEVTEEACDRLLAAQRTSGTHLAVISQHRFDDGTRRLREVLASGALGRVVAADCRVPWHRTQEYYDAEAWRGTWALDGGGALINQGIHTVDLLLWACGPAVSVDGAIATVAHEVEVEDVASAAITFAGGTLATLMASTATAPGLPARLALHGTDGAVVLEGDCVTLLAVRGQDVQQGQPTTDALQVATGGTRSAERGVTDGSEATAWGEAHRRQLLDLVHAVREDRPPLVDGEAGRAAVGLVRAVYRSAREGTRITL